MYRFKYTYSNGVEEFSRIFTLEEIEQGLQFDEVSDSLLLKDYKIIGRKLIENIEVIGYSNTFTEASSLSSKIKDNKLKARNKAIEDAISYIANKIRDVLDNIEDKALHKKINKELEELASKFVIYSSSTY